MATLHQNVSPVWPASGVGVAVLVLFGRYAMIGVALAAFAVNAWSGISMAAAGGIAFGNTLEACIGAWIVVSGRARLAGLGASARPVAVVLAAAVAPVVTAVVGVGSLITVDHLLTDRGLRLLLTWWIGDAIGILIMAPLLLSMAELQFERLRPSPRKVLQAIVIAVLSIFGCTMAFDGSTGTPSQFLLFPLLLLGGIWFGRAGTLTVAAAIMAYAAVATSTVGNSHRLLTDLLWLNTFLAVVAITALFVAEFLRAARSLQPAMVLFGGWALSGWLFANLQESNTQFDNLRLERLAVEAENAIQERLTTYSDALYAGASLHAASQSVERSEWRAFANSLDMPSRYPGIHGIGVIEPVSAADSAVFVAKCRADGEDEFHIHSVPVDQRPRPAPGEAEHFVITFIEPLDLNRKAMGLDVGSERNRRRAACAARDTGRPTITDSIVLVQDGKHRPGFLLYVPMYRTGTDPVDVQQRRRDFDAWIYAPFITEVFLQGVLSTDSEIDLHFFDGATPQPETCLFTTGEADSELDGDYDLLSQMTLGGRQFTLAWRRAENFASTVQGAPLLVGASLALVSLLLAGLVLSLQSVSSSTKLANQRSYELKHANQRLSEQVRERELAQREADRARSIAEVANRSKSEFLATMSHEIRTPINSVIGFADLLARSPMAEEQVTWATFIRTSGRTLLALINDILDFSKVEAGKMRMENVPFSPVIAAQDVVGLLAQKADEKNLQFELNVRSQPDRLVIGDPGRFAQVVMNLASNALKFTSVGSVRIEMSFALKDTDSGTLTVAVVDTGIGIPAAKLPRLFQEFSQADSSTTRRFGGTGLGLAICKRIAELMGGTISVTSEELQGSRFAFEMPVKLAAANASALDHSATVAADAVLDDSLSELASGKPMRVLLAEDVTMNQVLVRALLKRYKAIVDVAEDGQVAQELTATNSYDVILMDCQMPVLDGLEATAAIREREQQNAGDAAPVRTPIIAVTANALTGDRERCLAAGMDDYISKPIRPGDLDRVLQRWLPLRAEPLRAEVNASEEVASNK